MVDARMFHILSESFTVKLVFFVKTFKQLYYRCKKRNIKISVDISFCLLKSIDI